MDIEKDEQVGRSVALIFAVVALDLAASNCSFILNSSRATLIKRQSVKITVQRYYVRGT